MTERNNYTRTFWNNLKDYEVFISELVINEISKALDKKLKESLFSLVKNFGLLKINNEVIKLADAYLKARIFPDKYRNDAIHVAVSSVNNLDILVSWNFEHLVKVKTKL